VVLRWDGCGCCWCVDRWIRAVGLCSAAGDDAGDARDRNGARCPVLELDGAIPRPDFARCDASRAHSPLARDCGGSARDSHGRERATNGGRAGASRGAEWERSAHVHARHRRRCAAVCRVLRECDLVPPPSGNTSTAHAARNDDIAAAGDQPMAVGR